MSTRPDLLAAQMYRLFFIMVYWCSVGTCHSQLVFLRSWEFWRRLESSNLFRDLALVDINDEHGILRACHEDLCRALGGKGHAVQVLHVFVSTQRLSTPSALVSPCHHPRLPYVPYWRPPTRRHVDGPGTKGDNPLVMEEELPHGSISGRVYSKGRISLKFGTVEGEDTTLGGPRY